jgi:fructokinase
MSQAPLCGGIEAGGTKFVCAIGSGPDDLRDEIRFPTTSPGETIPRALDYFKNHPDRARLKAIGIASFGPVDPKPGSLRFGFITSTPKPGWRDTDLAGAVGKALDLPVGFDTDVNGAALAEARWGAGRGLDALLYVTIGTGVGGGMAIGGRALHGLVHPEMGHARLPRNRDRDAFKGICPFHGDCLEGIASGTALEARWGKPAEQLPPDHAAWDLEADYLAMACNNWICTLSPERIVLGGGVMQNGALFPMIRVKTLDLLAGYVQHPAILDGIDRMIVPPALGSRSGVLGAIVLAQQALSSKT